MLVSDTPEPRQTRVPEPFLPREVSRLIQPQYHREGFHVANLTGDVETMLSLGFNMTPFDTRFLLHILTCCIREADTFERFEVSMSDTQWRRFVLIRARFLRSTDFIAYRAKNLLNITSETHS